MVAKGAADGAFKKLKATFLYATGALTSIPTAAMEVILDLPPLQIYAQVIARSTACRIDRICTVKHR